MPDFEQIIKGIKAILQLIFGKDVPTWVLPLVGWAMLIALLLCALWGILFLLSKIQELWAQNFRPIFYNREEKQRSLYRRYFAEHIESEIIRLGRQEEWKDHRFTELEAEVEAEGQRRGFSFIPFLHRTSSGLRHEKSLSKALASSQERLILVEGEPGSGKSIALRHVTQTMANRAKKARNTKSIIPLYINLKELERPEGEAVDRILIETFVLGFLKRIKDRDIDKFLDEEFNVGLENGTWFFLFDSFDEIPEVLSSTEADATIRNYGNAIEDFLGGMNRCRGIVASRLFRGPKYFTWPRFTILSLTESRRLQLIRKANLKRATESELIGHLDTASDEIRAMATNPLFLNLLCEHMRDGNPFPQNTHAVFETYINSRFIRDELRIQKRFKLDSLQLRSAAETIAFCMAVDTDLGLSPSRENLKAAIERFNLTFGSDVDIILDALEFMKLARSEEGIEGVHSNRFTFAHRRFQEYFATCVVLREPYLIPPGQLLLDARWRETAVVMCQTQPLEVLTPLLEQADELLEGVCNDVLGWINELTESVLSEKHIAADDQQEIILDCFPWPEGLLHLLELLQEGFAGRITALPERLRSNVGKLVQTATEVGLLSDKRWALEVAGIAPEPVLTSLLNQAFLSSSTWLREIAYRQTAQLNHITPVIAQGIRNALLELASSHQLKREEHATKAHLMRLPRSQDYLSIMRLLLAAPKIDLCVLLVVSFVFISIFLVSKSFYPIGTLQFFLLVTFPFSLIFFSFIFPFVDVADGKELLTIILLIFMRAGIMTMLILFGFFLAKGTILKGEVILFILVVCAYWAFFRPFSNLAARTGKFAYPRWWFLLPIWPLLGLISNPRSVSLVISSMARAFKHTRIIMFGLIALVLGVILVYATISGLNYFFEHPSPWGGIIFLLLSCIMIVPMIKVILPDAYHAYQDWVRWRKWFNTYKETMTCQEFCEAIAFRSPIRTLSALGRIRVGHKLAATAETERFLKTLAFEIEVGQRIARSKRRDKSGNAAKVILPISSSNETKIEEIRNCAKQLGIVGPVVLDEIHLLWQDVHRARQNLSK